MGNSDPDSRVAIVLDEFAGPIATDVKLLSTHEDINQVVDGHAVLQSTAPITYSVKKTKGTCHFKSTAFPSSADFPQFEAIGVQTADGKGNATATGVLMSNGQYSAVTATTTYTVNPDGTGMSDTLSGGVHTKYIIVLNSKGSMSIATGIAANLIVTSECVK
jgi:hypothetical protein